MKYIQTPLAICNMKDMTSIKTNSKQIISYLHKNFYFVIIKIRTINIKTKKRKIKWIWSIFQRVASVLGNDGQLAKPLTSSIYAESSVQHTTNILQWRNFGKNVNRIAVIGNSYKRKTFFAKNNAEI